MSAIEHFQTTGGKEGLWPNAYFHSGWYLETNPDVRNAGVNPLWHYLQYGEKEGRHPSPWFDPLWYKKTYQSPHAKWSTALAHYLQFGRDRNFSPSPNFDVSYYLRQNPDVLAAKVDPVEHFFFQGHREGRNPSADFDTNFYRRRYLSDSDLNPLLHFLQVGRARGYRTKASIPEQVSFFTKASPRFEQRRLGIARLRPPRAKAIAFYLPQFHSIPENDEWWGRGFTDWHNVARGLPRFEGHYQPRIPGELGYYDLTDPEIMRRQITFARDAALGGFCFYYYWFNGKRLLERPMNMFMADATLDFPFCVMWANENWTRSWDGLNEHVLLTQDYNRADEVSLLAELYRHFSDPRYICFGGRPLFIIYRPALIPSARETIARWRETWRDKFDCDPLIFMVQGFGVTDPGEYDLDGAIEFPPHKLAAGQPTINTDLRILDPGFEGSVYAYEELMARSRAVEAESFPLLRTVTPGWDNDARRHGRGTTFHGSTPQKYEQWLHEMVEFARRHRFKGESVVFINAWNEWAEGAYLEPDVHYGAAYLNATARALVQRETAEKLKIVLIGHDAYSHGAQLMLLHLSRTLAHQFGLQVAIVLLEGGPLVAEYRAVTEVHLTNKSTVALEELLSRLSQRGFRHAIVNTTVSGRAAPLLKKCNMAVISLVHELPRLIKQYNLENEVAAITNYADRVVFASRQVAEGFRSIAEDLDRAKVVIRPQGLYTRWPVAGEAVVSTLREELGLKVGDKLVINVGFADLRKGFDIFKSVAQFVGRQRPDIHFAWLGNVDGTIKAWLLDVDDRDASHFHILDYTDDPVPLYEAADLFFLSSREDPFPTVVLEALRAGLPIVALRNSGGITDLVEKFGRLADPTDIAAIAEAIFLLLDAPESERRVSAESRRQVISEQFQFDEYAHDLIQMLLDRDLAKISVVVPNYNYAPYLQDRLDSIYAQTFPIFEVLVLDDSSSDSSLRILDDYAKAGGAQYHVIANETNSGNAYHQWEKGASVARGEFVWIAEADDLASATFLEEAMALMDVSNAGFVFCDSLQINERGELLAESYQYYFDTVMPGAFADNFVMDGHEFVRRFMSVKNLILNVSSVLWRRGALMTALATVGGEQEPMRLALDWKMYVSAALESGCVGFIAQSLNTHRRHSKSVTHSLDPERHFTEIEGLQRFVAEKVGVDRATEGKIAIYRAELRSQFGLETQTANGARADRK